MKEIIAKLLSKEVKLDKKEILNLIEIPPDESLGDYAFPCFILASKLKKNPIDIATNLADELKKSKEISATSKSKDFDSAQKSMISDIEAKGPYLNFFIDKKTLAKQVLKNIGKKPKPQNKKILIEHTSINPNASPHVGRIRNSLIGDSIKRILEFKGYKTETHYYVNDVSKQIALLCLSNKIKKFDDLLSEYMRLSKQLTQLEPKIFQILNKLEKGDKKTKAKFKKITDIAIKGQKKILEEAGIKFDYFDYESDFLKEQKKILSDLQKTGKLFKDKENRMVLDEEGQGIDDKMKAPYLVLTRNDGTGLYPLRDIAYTLYKLKRASENVIILGEDQKLYFQQLKIALRYLKKQAPLPVHYSFVLIQTEEGKNKMSTRTGDLVLFENFLNETIERAKKEMHTSKFCRNKNFDSSKTESFGSARNSVEFRHAQKFSISDKRKTKGDPKKIALAAVKYAILRNEPNKNIIINPEEALSFTGETGPYLLYSYARAGSILRKVGKNKSKSKFHTPNAQEFELIKKLSRFEENVEHAYKTFNPSIIANYSFQLAQLFNEFYHSSKVIGSEEEAFRIQLVKAFRIVIKSSLSLLGIEVIERM